MIINKFNILDPTVTCPLTGAYFECVKSLGQLTPFPLQLFSVFSFNMNR